MACSLLAIATALAIATFSASHASGQATPAAGHSEGAFRAGVAYSNGSTDEIPQRIGGFTLYGNYTLLPHFSIEADIHLLQFFTPRDYAQRTYLGGGRLFYRKKRYEPYVRFLGGVGYTISQARYVSIPGSNDSYGVFAGGGGLDIQVPHRLVIRAFDFEKQVWPAYVPRDLAPSILSFGVAYQIR